MEHRTKISHVLDNHRLTRRGALGMAASMAVVLNARGATAARQDASPTSGWSFTDDKGVTVELPQAPERLVIDVNAAAPLWDFGIRPLGVFGWNVSESGDFGDAGGNVDPATVELAGNVNEPVQLEEMAALNPDLIITVTWAPDDPIDYWSIMEELLPQVQEIAPLLALSATGRADVNTERFAELAAALGADLDTPDLAEAKERYETAITDFKAATAAKPDVSFLYLSVLNDTIWVASPRDWADLNFYLESGLSIVEPDVEPGMYWEELSQEQALKYPADVMMASTRPGSLQLEDLREHPTFSAHPAVQAGQVAPWNQDFIMSYQGMSDAIEHLTATLNASEKII